MGWLFTHQSKDELVDNVTTTEIDGFVLRKFSLRGNDLYLLYQDLETYEYWMDTLKLMKGRHGYGYKSMTLFNPPKSFLKKIQHSPHSTTYMRLLDEHIQQKQFYIDLKASLAGADYDICVTDYSNNPAYIGRVWYTDYGRKNQLVIRVNECGTLIKFRDTSLDGLYSPI